MADVKKLIETILAGEKLSSLSDSRVYRDEPIIRTASQMQNYMPPKYREMRNIAKSPEAFSKSSAWIFYTQGKFMEDFEDDFDYRGEFMRYYPTYQGMNDLQLRGYFSWRANVRRGVVNPTSLSFVFVYIYELLNLIGVSSPQEGFNTLRSFWSAYSKIDTRINHYVKLWLSDFAVYYNLDPALLSEFTGASYESYITTLLNPSQHETDEVFTALNVFSTYNLSNSRFYKEHPEDVKQVVCGVFSDYSEYYAKNRKTTLCEKLFGRVFTGQYYMFRSAVFHDRMRYRDYEYEISSIHKYRCKNGVWECKKFSSSGEKSTQLGAMLKTVDCLMREKYAFKSPIKPGKATKALTDIIEKNIEKYLNEKKLGEAVKIEIDVSKLSGIRSAALETQGKLIIDEEPEELPAAEAEAASPVNETVLDNNEYRLMQLLLYGGDFAAFAREKRMMLTVAVEAINEKLFDEFGDTVIIFSGDTPEVLEDYADELKGIIKI